MTPCAGRWAKIAGWTGLAAALLLAGWWACTVPYRPGKVYDAIPSSAVLVTRHLEVGPRWPEILENPIAQSLLATAGVSILDAREAAGDEETLKWVAKLTGREAILAFVPEGNGHRQAWLAAAWLGGGVQRLRWQLEVFRVPGFRWLGRSHGCSLWEVENADVGLGRHLILAFAEGMLLAAVSSDPMAIESMIVALERPRTRLRETDGTFARFAGRDGRDVPDIAWVKENARWEHATIGWGVGGVVAELPEVSGTRMSFRVEFGGGWSGNEAFPATADRAPRGWEGLETVLGATPCAVAVASRAALDWLWRTPGLDGITRHSILMALAGSGDRVLAACLDGDLSGRLSFGMMSAIGLRGIRIPTLVLATPSPDGAEAARQRLQKVLDSCNARYRGAFIMRPAGTTAGIELWSLESAGGDEWVDMLSLEDRPACGVFGDWLLVASNLDALRSLARGAGAEATTARTQAVPGATGPLRPAWALAAESETAPAWAWLDIERAGKAAIDALSMVAMLQRWTPGQDAEMRAATQAAIGDAKTWIHSLIPFAEGRASLERNENGLAVSATLGKP